MKHFDTGTVTLKLKLLLIYLSFDFLRWFSSSRHDGTKQRGSSLRCFVSVTGFKASTVWEPLDFLCVLFWQFFTIAPSSPVYYWAARKTLITLLLLLKLKGAKEDQKRPEEQQSCLTVPCCVSVLCEASEIQFFWRTLKHNLRRQGLPDSLSQGESCQPTAANSGQQQQGETRLRHQRSSAQEARRRWCAEAPKCSEQGDIVPRCQELIEVATAPQFLAIHPEGARQSNVESLWDFFFQILWNIYVADIHFYDLAEAQCFCFSWHNKTVTAVQNAKIWRKKGHCGFVMSAVKKCSI